MKILTTVIERITEIALPYGVELYNVIAPGATKFFGIFVALWFVWSCIKGMVDGSLEPWIFIKKMVLFMTIQAFLESGTLFKEFFIDPLLEAVDDITKIILESGLKKNLVNGVDVNDGRSAMLLVIDECTSQVIRVYLEINKGVNLILNTDAIILSPFMLFPYLVLALMFGCYVMEYILKVTTISAVFPILLICLGFDSTKGAFWGGVKMIFQGALNLILAVIAITIVMHVVNSLLAPLAGLSGRELATATKTWVGGENFWACLITGGIACLFLGKTPTIASSIAGAVDTSAAAAIVAGYGATAFTKAIGVVGGGVLPATRAAATVVAGGIKAAGAGASAVGQGAKQAMNAYQSSGSGKQMSLPI